jgi:hypothetical protein
MISSDAEIGVAVLVFDYLENGLQHSNDGTVRAIFAFGEPA